MFRMIGFILIFAVLLAFVIVNYGNTCDISFGFTKVEKVPVFMTIFASFMLGLLFSIPLAFGIGKKRKAKAEKPPKPHKGDNNEKIEELSASDGTYGIN